MTVEELKKAVADGTVDTVLLAIADMEGRLQGKRLTASHFLGEVLEHGAEGCNYLLAVDVDMETVGGYAMSSWDTGYGDFEMVPDLDTLRLVPWLPGTAMVMADIRWNDGREVAASPRQILRRQLARLAERGMSAKAATELEFIVFRNTYEEAWKKGFHDLEPANLYNIDYSLLGTARVEPLIRRIRNEMSGAGMEVENSKGECNLGQHEINFRYDTALRSADNHVIYKNGAKEIAAQEDHAITFMAKFNEREGNSCHIHCSLAARGRQQRLRRRPGAVRPLRRRPARLHGGADADVRAARQLLQALRRGLLRADRGRLGARQPHLLAAGGRPRRGAAGREPAAGRRRQSLPGAEPR